MKKAVIEIRSQFETLDDAPLFRGDSDEFEELWENNPEWTDWNTAWLFITNGDGSTERLTMREFLDKE